MATSPNCAPPANRQENGCVKACGLESGQHAIAASIGNLLSELGVEPSLTVQEAAVILRWSYWKARRYFSHVDGICVSYQPKRYKRPYRTFTIPVSVFAREWQKMTGQGSETAHVIRNRLGLVIPK
jgi:hypothetical protein